MLSTNWKTLRVHNGNLPTLLVKAELRPTGYNILLTDLGSIWSEKLTRNEIIERARSCGSSIDPSQGADQQDILLNHIAKALDNDDGTTLEICQDPEHSESLLLDLSTPLPGALSPLKWTVHLRSSSARLMEAEFVMPLLHQADSLRKQVQSLVTEIHNKDRVISKISDRLEVSGNDLTTIFPNVSRVKTSRKRPQREQLGSHVQGLSDFNELSWRTQIAESGITGSLSPDTLDEIFAGCSATGVESSGCPRPDKWWQHLTGEAFSEKASLREETVDHQVLDDQQMTGHDVQIDEFQRQSTPPRLAKDQAYYGMSALVVPAVADDESATLDDESTEDEDDLDAPPAHRSAIKETPHTGSHLANPLSLELASSISSKSRKSVHNSSAESGTTLKTVVGERRPEAGLSISKSESTLEVKGAVSTSPSSQDGDTTVAGCPSPAKPKAKLGVIGGKRNELEHEPTAPFMSRRPKLGMFGGKNKPSASVDVPLRNPAEAETEMPLSPSAVKKHSKPGTFGGTTSVVKDEQSSPPDAEQPSHVNTPRPTKEATPEPEETEEDRANRKRSQLKMELEEKAKAHVKKKRKF